MTHSIPEIIAKISALFEPMQQEIIDFIEFMQVKVAPKHYNQSMNRPC